MLRVRPLHTLFAPATHDMTAAIPDGPRRASRVLSLTGISSLLTDPERAPYRAGDGR